MVAAHMLCQISHGLVLLSSLAAAKVTQPYKSALVEDAIDLGPRPVNSLSKRYLELPLSRRGAGGIVRKRATSPASVALQITSEASGYTAAIEFGTPAQTLNLILDTGSPLTWASSTNVSAYTPSGDPKGETTSELEKELCTSNGCYSSAGSSTYADTPDQVFAISYVDTSEAIGAIIEDKVVFGGLSVSSFQFGLVTYQYNPDTSGAPAGIIGLGPTVSLTGYPSITDATGVLANTTDYAFNSPTLLNQFVSAGVLESTAFSLYLNDKGNGSVLLGGVDHAKYSGELVVVPISSPADQSLQVTLLSVGINGSTSSTDSVTLTDTIAVLDSGTTEVYLPTSVVQLIASAFGGTVESDQPVVKCSALTAGTTIDFHFQNGALVRTPVDLLVDEVAQQSGVRYCRIGIIATAADSYFLLGDYFLRSAYVVYDWDQTQIALAQVMYTDATNISAISTGTFGIPGAVYNSSSSSASGTASVATVTGVSQPWSETSSGTTTTSAGSRDYSASIGLVLTLSILSATAAVATFI